MSYLTFSQRGKIYITATAIGLKGPAAGRPITNKAGRPKYTVSELTTPASAELTPATSVSSQVKTLLANAN